MKKRLTLALAVGAFVLAMLPGVVSAAGARCTVLGTRGDDAWTTDPANTNYPLIAVDAVVCGGKGNDRIHTSLATNPFSGVFLGGPGHDDITVLEAGGSFQGGPGHDTVYRLYGHFVGGPGDDAAAIIHGYFDGGPGADSAIDVHGRFDGGRDDDAANCVFPGATFDGGRDTDEVRMRADVSATLIGVELVGNAGCPF